MLDDFERFRIYKRTLDLLQAAKRNGVVEGEGVEYGNRREV